MLHEGSEQPRRTRCGGGGRRERVDHGSLLGAAAEWIRNKWLRDGRRERIRDRTATATTKSENATPTTTT